MKIECSRQLSAEGPDRQTDRDCHLSESKDWLTWLEKKTDLLLLRNTFGFQAEQVAILSHLVQELNQSSG